jgi:hypothetical protein
MTLDSANQNINGVVPWIVGWVANINLFPLFQEFKKKIFGSVLARNILILTNLHRAAYAYGQVAIREDIQFIIFGLYNTL